jgi:AIPR protein
MNNGVTIIARTLRATGTRINIEEFQIVNGCQTSHVIADVADALDNSVMVPLRLIATQNDKIIESIIHATNRQTEVKREQFLAATEIAKRMEAFFASFPNGHKLFYERRSHQYDSMPIERTRIVTPTNLIRAFAAMFLAEPHRTTRSYGALVDKIGKDILVETHKLEPYYVAAYTLYKLEYLFRNLRLDSKDKPARFHILLAARLLANKFPMPQMNARDIEQYCKTITDILWDVTKADKMIEKAASVVSECASGNFDRDNIRTQPFTEKVVEYCKNVSFS